MEENLRDWIKPGQAIRKQKTDRAVRTLFFLAALISGSCIVLITFFILMKGIQPFLPNYAYGTVSLKDFLFGTLWRQDQGVYGVGFIVINTLISAFGALLLAFPISVLTALFIVKIAPKPIKPFMKTVVELLASIPSVVYGRLCSRSDYNLS